MNVHEELVKAFPGYDSPERLVEWKTVRDRLVVGAEITGIVVSRQHFGVFVDIGVGFPALLEVISFDKERQSRIHNRPRREDLVEYYPEIGESVTAWIAGFGRDDFRQIGLTQSNGNPWV